LLVNAVDVAGASGGTIDNGRWQLDVPAGAFAGTAHLTLGVTGMRAPACQLQVTPQSLDGFVQPLTLTCDCRGVGTRRIANFVMLRVDPARATWVPVPGSTVDVKHHTVSAPITHFAMYGVGNSDGTPGW
jgi:hypothetical protein